MRVAIIAVGRLKAGPERELVARYAERIGATARTAGLTGIDLREIDESRARRAPDRKAEEARAIRALLMPGAIVVMLDETGASLSSEAFAARLGKARDAGASAFTLVIGGPDGLDAELRASAALTVSLGAMTMPHQLARVLAAEQVYRAITILTGHPYHRA